MENSRASGSQKGIMEELRAHRVTPKSSVKTMSMAVPKRDAYLIIKSSTLRLAVFALTVLVVSQLIAVITITIIFSTEIAKLKYAGKQNTQQLGNSNSSSQQQVNYDINSTSVQQLYEEILVLTNATQELNSSVELVFKQLLQDRISSSTATEQVNSSLSVISQQLSQDISDISELTNQINTKTQQINSSIEALFQELILASEVQAKQANASLELLAQGFTEGIEAVTQRVNTSVESLYQQLQTNHLLTFTAIEQVNSSLQLSHQKLIEDITVSNSRTGEVNSSLQLLSQRLDAFISDISRRTEQINSSLETLSQQFIQDISDVNFTAQEVEFSLDILSEELIGDISNVDSRTTAVNSSLEFLSQQLLQDITATDSTTQQVNISLSEKVLELQGLAEAIPGVLESFPASSCSDIPSFLPSSLYWIRAPNGSVVRVFCFLGLPCGATNSGGWYRIADTDFSRGDACFNGWEETILATGVRVCNINELTMGCILGMEYSPPMQGFNYSRVCGRIVGYQFGLTEAFSRLILGANDINDVYLDGVSLTYGNPRQHLWSFAVGVTNTRTDRFGCPCASSSSVNLPDSFVGHDYFCDSGATSLLAGTPWPNNPLWDGVGCGGNIQVCCTFNGSPWFYRELSQPISDDIELRLCKDEGAGENIQISSVEIYVQ